MKIKITIMLIVLTGCWSLLPAQYLINRGADIVISSGSSLVIDGDYENQLDGSLGNSGDILLTGDFNNNSTSGSLLSGTSGTVRFIGSLPQNIAGTAVTYFNDLDLQNDANLTAAVIALYGDLQLSSTYLTLGNGVVVMQPGTQIFGANSNGYVVTNSNGFLRQYVGGSNKVFPIGTSARFAPVTMNNSGGAADYYSARVFADVRTNGLSGATIPEIDDCVNMTWDINDFNAGGSNLSVTPYWSAAMEGASFDRTSCAVGHYTGGSWDPDQEGSAAGGGPYSITRSGITSLSAFAVGDLESPMAIPLDIRLDAMAFLDGPFNGAGMNAHLNADGLVPLSQPYSGAPWNYPGLESVGSIPAGAIDWVLIELRDAANAATATGATAFARKAAFLMADGTIADLDGSSIPTFTGSLSNNLFVVVYHRNHLPIMSANAVTPAGGIYSYDFTSALSQAYLNGQKDLGGGNYGLAGGDANADKLVDGLDYIIWRNNAGLSGYMASDHDMDSEVNNQDKNDVWEESKFTASAVPN